MNEATLETLMAVSRRNCRYGSRSRFRWFHFFRGSAVRSPWNPPVLGVVLGQPQDPLQDYGGTVGFVFTPLSVAF